MSHNNSQLRIRRNNACEHLYAPTHMPFNLNWLWNHFWSKKPLLEHSSNIIISKLWTLRMLMLWENIMNIAFQTSAQLKSAFLSQIDHYKEQTICFNVKRFHIERGLLFRGWGYLMASMLSCPYILPLKPLILQFFFVRPMTMRNAWA